MAAYKAGIKTVIVPKANIGDMDEIDDAVKLNLEFVFAEKIQDVLEVALTSLGKESNVPLSMISKRNRNKYKDKGFTIKLLLFTRKGMTE